MAQDTQEIIANATTGRLSSIKNLLSENDVSIVWDSVSEYIEKQLSQQKGVTIQGLGTFAISQHRLEVSSTKCVLSQRPVFNMSEKFAQTHGLQCHKYIVEGSFPVFPLNFASIAFESPFDRDMVERCVKEIISSFSRALVSKRNVFLRFYALGTLTVRDNKVKMKFSKYLVNSIDTTGKAADAMMNRVGTADSVMSGRLSSLSSSASAFVLPRIQKSLDGIYRNTLQPLNEGDERQSPADWTQNNMEEDVGQNNQQTLDMNNQQTLSDQEIDELRDYYPPADPATEQAIENLLRTTDESYVHLVTKQNAAETQEQEVEAKEEETKSPSVRPGSRMALPMSTANGVSLTEELIKIPTAPKSNTPQSYHPSPPSEDEDQPVVLKPPTPPRLTPLSRSRTEFIKHKAPTPPTSACGHPVAGQELCYLCHQRARLNVPVSFTEERKRRDAEEERLLQQYQKLKDTEETLKDQEKIYARRHDSQKVSAFNLGVSEALAAKRKMKDVDPQRAYIFTRRPLTPSYVPKREEYLKDLDQQVQSKSERRRKLKDDEDFLERLEQVQLAEDLAAQREQYIKDRAKSMETYKSALDTQMRFKPLPMPMYEPDHEFFGKNDMTNEKMAERRRRANKIFQEQNELVEQKKRDAILARLAEQQEEEQVLKRAKSDLVDERVFKHSMRYDMRKRLETDWHKMAEHKRAHDLEDRLRSLSPGILLHEQCDHYNRCKQCKRRLNNCGETNVWSESRYIPGATIMV